MIRAARVAFDINLQALSNFLRQQGIDHRINEESGEQVIWARNAQQADLIQKLLQSWQQGDLQLDESLRNQGEDYLTRKRQASFVARLIRAFFQFPVTSLLVVSCLLVAAISFLGRNLEPVEFLFYPRLSYAGLLPLLASIDNPLVLLQTLAPMFLHFGELHIIFNMLWLWYFGRQLEKIQSSWIFMIIVVITSFTANTSQYLVSQAANFGGMSGVVYGLVGYAWVLHNFVPGYRLMLNNTMFGFFIVALVAMEVFASSWIASAAHAGGLLAGLFAGMAMVVVIRLHPARRNTKDDAGF